MLPETRPEHNSSNIETLLYEVHPDFTVDLFHDVVASAYHEHVSKVTGFEPPAATGQIMYLKQTGYLRNLLSTKKGWEPSNEKNIARMEHPSTGMIIACTGADSSTGYPSQTPHTRGTKGKATMEVYGQLRMTWEDEPSSPRKKMWYLLTYLDKRNNEIRMELSLPGEITDKKKIKSWAKRIIIPPLSLSGSFTIDPNILALPTTEIDIAVTKKKAV